MRLPTLRRTRSAEPGRILGTARLDRRTKRLVGRLRPGDIAGPEPTDQALRPAVQARDAGDCSRFGAPGPAQRG